MISDGPFSVHAKVASHGVSAPLTGEMDAIVPSLVVALLAGA
jgi:hypothetical protein